MGGFLASLLGILAGSEMRFQSRDVQFRDFVIYVIGIGFLIWVFRQHRVEGGGSNAAPPVAAPASPPMTIDDRGQAAAVRPWKFAGWMVVVLMALVLMVPCLIGIGILVPYLSMRSAEAELGTLVFDWDADQVIDIKLQGGVWHGRTHVPRVYQTIQNPRSRRLLPGESDVPACRQNVHD